MWYAGIFVLLIKNVTQKVGLVEAGEEEAVVVVVAACVISFLIKKEQLERRKFELRRVVTK